MLLRLAYYDEPILRKKVSPVEKIDDELINFINDMIETMNHYDGAGLAAPQVFRSAAVFLTNIPKKTSDGEWGDPVLRVFINPKILAVSEQSWTHSEGCLSIPNIYEDITRPVTIKIEATDLERERFQEELSGWDARTFLHENDHLNGVLLIDRVKGKRRKEIDPLLRMIKKKYQRS